MKKASRSLAGIIIFSTLSTPAHTITYREWQGITGLGAIGGALAGLMIYNAMAENDHEKQHHQDVLVIGRKNQFEEKKGNKARSILATFASGAAGAATGALALGLWFWSYTPHARQEQAQELIHLAQVNRFIAQNIDLANPVAVQNTIREVYVQNGQEFNRALWEMTTYQTNLQRAQNLCAQAHADANADAVLQDAIGQTQATIHDLLNRVGARAQAIRDNPAYQAELAAAAQRRFAQDEMWREFERQRFIHGMRWHFVWPRPVEVVHHNHIFVPQPIYVPRPAPAHIPAAHYYPPVHHPAQVHIHAPRPAYNSAPKPQPTVMQPAPIPPQIPRMLHKALVNQRPQVPAGPARVVPMTPAQAFGRGRPPYNPF